MIFRLVVVFAMLVVASLAPSFAQQQITITGGNASSSPYGPSSSAADGNPYTVWNSGGPPTQWIDLDMGFDRMVQTVNMLTAMYPHGPVNHNVYGRTSAGQWVVLGTWNGWATDNQWLGVNVTEMTPIRYVVVQTTASPSWVAWREIQAFERQQPRSAGDIVGRDLGSPFVGAFGHIGFFDGENVMQVMNESPVVQSVSYANFASKSTPWPPVYTNIPNFGVTSCFSTSSCNFLDQWSTSDRVTLPSRTAMAKRAHQIQVIGADYTLSAFGTSANPAMYDRNTRTYFPPVRGVYRCDTFVRDLFAFTYTPNGAYWMPGTGSYLRIERIPQNVPASWTADMQTLFQSTAFPSPSTTLSRLSDHEHFHHSCRHVVDFAHLPNRRGGCTGAIWPTPERPRSTRARAEIVGSIP
ncbi:MAG: hypothetical protein ABIR26_16490 [Ramlibacter sp.]